MVLDSARQRRLQNKSARVFVGRTSASSRPIRSIRNRHVALRVHGSSLCRNTIHQTRKSSSTSSATRVTSVLPPGSPSTPLSVWYDGYVSYLLYLTSPVRNQHIAEEQVRAAFELQLADLIEKVQARIEATTAAIPRNPAMATQLVAEAQSLRATRTHLKEKARGAGPNPRLTDTEAAQISGLLHEMLRDGMCRDIRCGGCGSSFPASKVREKKWGYKHGPLAAGGGYYWTCPRGHVLHWELLFVS